jgi:stearoyl-CoA desaturase (delta-9 desaturase)
MLSTIIFALVLAEVSMFGVTAGAHRYWSHRSFSAKTPLRLLLAACYLTSGQESIWFWAALHRLHHKHVDTEADPHNSNRGFFYSHIGWLFLWDYQEFRKNLRKIDTSDIDRDLIVRLTEMSTNPTVNKLVSFFAGGEGSHNYHHVFPWDYKAAELGLYRWNISAVMIDFFAWIGLAYDLKTVSKETLMRRMKRIGNQHPMENGY